MLAELERLLTSLFGSAIGLLIPYYVPFFLSLTVAFLIYLLGSSAASSTRIKQAWILYAISNALGTVIFVVALMLAIFVFVLSGPRLNAAPGDSLGDSMFYGAGQLRLVALFLSFLIAAAALSALSGVLHRLVFRNRLPHRTAGGWTWYLFRSWPASFALSLAIALLILIGVFWINKPVIGYWGPNYDPGFLPILAQVLCGLAFGWLTGKAMIQIADDARESVATNQRYVSESVYDDEEALLDSVMEQR